MRNAMIALSPLLIGLAVTPAQAADVTGRVELKGGYDEPRATIRFATVREDDFSTSDFGYGLEAGVDLGIADGFLVGLYGGVDFSDAEECKDDVFEDINPGDRACIDSGRNVYAGLRAGLAANEIGLVYIKGGYSRGKFGFSYDDNRVGGNDFEGRGTSSGYHLGAGVEMDVARNVYVKGEFIHTWYEDAIQEELVAGEQVDPTRIQMLFGIGLRFGGAPVMIADAELPPPPPPAPAATQTCADGTVILATDVCPAPPVQAAPPPPAPSSGERG